MNFIAKNKYIIVEYKVVTKSITTKDRLLVCVCLIEKICRIAKSVGKMIEKESIMSDKKNCLEKV